MSVLSQESERSYAMGIDFASFYDFSIGFWKRSLKISKGYQNPYIEEEQTKQWPNEKEQKDKQRSTKHTYKTKDQVTHEPHYKTSLSSGVPEG